MLTWGNPLEQSCLSSLCTAVAVGGPAFLLVQWQWLIPTARLCLPVECARHGGYAVACSHRTNLLGRCQSSELAPASTLPAGLNALCFIPSPLHPVILTGHLLLTRAFRIFLIFLNFFKIQLSRRMLYSMSTKSLFCHFLYYINVSMH